MTPFDATGCSAKSKLPDALAATRSELDLLFDAALSKRGAAELVEFCRFLAQFNELSAFNAMLGRVQRPGALALATRRQWERIGRYIKPDCVPVVLLRPFGPVFFVFEQADTEGGGLPHYVENPFRTSGTLP